MKKVFLIICIAFMAITVFAQDNFFVYKADGSTAKFVISEVDSISFIAPPPTTGVENGYEWVDLGLPSGLKWATCNIGANSPEKYGSYFSWGETSTKNYYMESYYSYSETPLVLPLNNDAAHVKMGGSWRMPTETDKNELRDNCTWTWTTNYNNTGVVGVIVTSKKNSNHLFFPAAGRYYNVLNDAGSIGYYWLSTSYLSYASVLCFRNGNPIVVNTNVSNCYGSTIRGVCP